MRFCLFVIVTLCTSIMTALAGTIWVNVDWQTKFLICVSVLGTVSSTIMAFLDNSMKQAREGRDPLTGLSIPPFASQAQVDAGLSTKTIVSPATLAKTLDQNLPP